MKRTRSTSPSRRSSDRVLILAFAAGLTLAAPAAAQDATLLPPPILVIDQDRLFAETHLGAATIADLEKKAQELAAENQEIEAELIAEEKSLTERRPTLDAEAFRALADAFDAKVQQLRAAQDEKARRLTRTRDDARSDFLKEVGVIISEIVREKGAVVVIDRRDVFLSAERIDITDESIRRVNEADGRAPD